MLDYAFLSGGSGHALKPMDARVLFGLVIDRGRGADRASAVINRSDTGQSIALCLSGGRNRF
jgi:hypothetical protein